MVVKLVNVTSAGITKLPEIQPSLKVKTTVMRNAVRITGGSMQLIAFDEKITKRFLKIPKEQI